jgi:hypothetical protein
MVPSTSCTNYRAEGALYCTLDPPARPPCVMLLLWRCVMLLLWRRPNKRTRDKSDGHSANTVSDSASCCVYIESGARLTRPLVVRNTYNASDLFVSTGQLQGHIQFCISCQCSSPRFEDVERREGELLLAVECTWAPAYAASCLAEATACCAACSESF